MRSQGGEYGRRPRMKMTVSTDDTARSSRGGSLTSSAGLAAPRTPSLREAFEGLSSPTRETAAAASRCSRVRRRSEQEAAPGAQNTRRFGQGAARGVRQPCHHHQRQPRGGWSGWNP